MKSGIARTPPMMPASTPKSAPAKHAYRFFWLTSTREGLHNMVVLTDAASAMTRQL